MLLARFDGFSSKNNSYNQRIKTEKEKGVPLWTAVKTGLYKQKYKMYTCRDSCGPGAEHYSLKNTA